MKNGRVVRIFCGRAWVLAAACLWMAAQHEAEAQAPPSPDTKERLKTTVHLRLGATTLSAIARRISEQTGLTVQAAPYLQQRQFVVQMDDLSASDALDSLAECNGWKWREQEPGRVVIERPAIVAPQGLLEVAAAMGQALPKDIQRFIGRDVPESDLRAAYAPLHPEQPAAATEHWPLHLLEAERLDNPLLKRHATRTDNKDAFHCTARKGVFVVRRENSKKQGHVVPSTQDRQDTAATLSKQPV